MERWFLVPEVVGSSPTVPAISRCSLMVEHFVLSKGDARSSRVAAANISGCSSMAEPLDLTQVDARSNRVSPAILQSRLMAGHWFLVPGMGVRVPPLQPCGGPLGGLLSVKQEVGVRFSPSPQLLMRHVVISLFSTDAFADLDVGSIERAHSWINRDGAPRDECFMSTRTDSYTYGRGIGERTYFPIAYSAVIGMIRVKLKDLVGIDYEACFSNKYVDEKKHLGWHADDSPSINHDVGITVISFGAEREIWFREFGVKGVEGIEKLMLPHGSLLVMPAGFQSTHQHRIPKWGAKSDLRISLTFRKLK